MRSTDFQILLIDVKKVVFNVLIKKKTRIYAAPAVKGLNTHNNDLIGLKTTIVVFIV